MRHGEQRAVKILQRALQHLAAVHVQMVGRLVQQQQVVVAQHQLGQRHAPLFAAGQGLDGLIYIVAGKQEKRQHAADAIHFQARKFIPDLVQNVLFRVEPRLMLLIVAHIHIRTEYHRAAVRLKPARDDVQQRGFAHAVRPDDRHAVAQPQLKAEVLKQLASFKALGNVLHAEHLFAGAPPRLEAHAQLLLALRPFQAFHLFKPLLAALRRLDGLFAVKHAIALDDGLLPRNLRLLQVVFLDLALDVRLTLYGKNVVIALVLHDVPHGDLSHAVAHGV